MLASMEAEEKSISLRRSVISRLLFSVLLCLAVLLHWDTLVSTVQSFCNPLQNMSHGWLIPIISIHAIWSQREQLKIANKNYSIIGFLGILITLCLFWIGNVYSALWLRQLSLVINLWFLIYAVWGWKIAKLTVFPVWYLVFTIYFPGVLEELIHHLQQISSVSAFYLMHGFCFEVFQQGNNLYSNIEGSEFQLAIAEVCSGIRLLTALTAFTAAYAWYSQKTVIKKWLLFACSIPVAILCNVIRVFSICLVAAIFGQDAAVGYYHDYSGYVLVLLSILFIFQCATWINNYACSFRSRIENSQPQ